MLKSYRSRLTGAAGRAGTAGGVQYPRRGCWRSAGNSSPAPLKAPRGGRSSAVDHGHPSRGVDAAVPVRAKIGPRAVDLREPDEHPRPVVRQQAVLHGHRQQRGAAGAGGFLQIAPSGFMYDQRIFRKIMASSSTRPRCANSPGASAKIEIQVGRCIIRKGCDCGRRNHLPPDE